MPIMVPIFREYVLNFCKHSGDDFLKQILYGQINLEKDMGLLEGQNMEKRMTYCRMELTNLVLIIREGKSLNTITVIF
jgi:hypothetical protein